LCAAALHLPAREVLVAGVDGFELAPINRELDLFVGKWPNFLAVALGRRIQFGNRLL
jgi:hypothetical protein